MRCLVTGGLGNIGSALARRLLGAGHDVTVVDDGRNVLPGVVTPFGIEVVRLPIESPGLRERLVGREPDVVHHLAASASVEEGETNPLHYAGNNIENLRALLETLLSLGSPIRVVHAGSCAVYAEHAGPMAESHPTLPQSWYGWTKLAAERLLGALAANGTLSWIGLRHFNVVGGDDHVDRLLPRAIACAALGLHMGVNGGGLPHAGRDGGARLHPRRGRRRGTCRRDGGLDVGKARSRQRRGNQRRRRARPLRA